MFIRRVHQEFVEMGNFLFFLVFLLAVPELKDGFLEVVENGTGEEGEDFGKKLELFLLMVGGKEGLGGSAHVPVDLW